MRCSSFEGTFKRRSTLPASAPSFACKRHKKRAARAPGFHSANDIGAIAARRQRHKNVLSCDKRFNLPRKDPFESEVVACRGQYRRICSERQSRQARAFRSKPHDQFRGEMESIRGAAAVPKKNELAAPAQGGCGFLRELRDPADQLDGKTLLDASAFLELAADFFGRRGHRCLTENDFFAVT